MTRAPSSLVISRSLPATATTPRLLKDRTEEPETPTQARAICTPAMISASSAARLIASIVASTLTILPLRVPRFAEAPLPMTSSVPFEFCSPISTQIFVVPMSQETRKFSGFAIRVPTGLSSERAPRSVGAFQNDAVRKTQVYGSRLPTPTDDEVPHLQQRPDLFRGVTPEHSNRPSTDGIHHTENAVGQCINFRERGEILREARAKILEQRYELGRRARVRGNEHV